MRVKFVVNVGWGFAFLVGLTVLSQRLSHSQQADPARLQTKAAAAAQAHTGKADEAGHDRYLEEVLIELRKQKNPSPIVIAHDRLLSEQVDRSWAPAAHQRIGSYLHAHVGDRIDVSAVECRASLCEIRALGHGTNSSNVDKDLRDWNEQWHRMPKEPWWAKFQLDEKKSFCGIADVTGKLAVLCYAIRSQQKN